VERDEILREKFRGKIHNLNKENLIYLDETGMNDNEVLSHGWSIQGSRLYGLKKSKKSARISVISTLSHGKLDASFLFEGSCSREVFEIYLEEILVPKLNPGKILVLDNASFHKGGNIENIIKNAGCEVLYLPPYSPDFNPIEQKWFPLKLEVKKQMQFYGLGIYESFEKTLNSGKH
jgi:transposase